jgi:hypothetical protein
LPQLTSLSESHFRKEHKLSPTENLSESSFNFPGDQFTLNDNYGIGDNVLVFHFNTYEIGPGAMGDTEIEIRYAEMRHLLKPGSGLLRYHIEHGAMYPQGRREVGMRLVENVTEVYDLHATILQLLGLDHKKLTYRFGGRDVSLTDIHGHVVRDILA